MTKKLKIIVLAIVSLLMLGNIQAQVDTTQTLEDILRRIEGKSSGESSGSGDNESRSSNSSKSSSTSSTVSTGELTMDLVYPSLFLVRQEYKVKTDDGTDVTKDGQAHWDMTLGIGVQVGKQLLVPKQLYRPWEYDDSYAKVKLKYPDAVALPAKLKGVMDDDYIALSEAVQGGEGKLSSIANSGKAEMGLMASEGTEGQFMLVLISVDSPNSESPSIYQKIRSLDGGVWKGQKLILSNFEAPSNCIGGVLFQQVQAPGQLTMKVAGIGSMIESDMVIEPAKGGSSSSSRGRGESDRRNSSDDKKSKDKKDKEVKEDDKESSSSRSRGRTRGRGERGG